MITGFIAINKSAGPSSFAVVKSVQRALGLSQAGHAGTLDPGATGVLVIALGSSTRLLPWLPTEPKKYRFGIKFGIETDTLDAEGEVTKTNDPIPSEAALRAILPNFVGNICQIPPKYSAVKIDGKRAYDRARKGEAFEIKSRTITISLLELNSYNETSGEAILTVVCSGGTYVRSLARDIAVALSTCSYASSIHRVAVGKFTDAMALPDTHPAAWQNAIIPVQTAFDGFPQTIVNRDQLEALSHGIDISITSDTSLQDTLPCFCYTEQGSLAAVCCKTDSGAFHPEKVFLSV